MDTVAVMKGLGVLTYWETYVAGVEYLAIFMGPMVVAGLVWLRSGKGGLAVGCLSMLLLPVLQAFAVVVFVLTLSPIILGFSEDAAWSFPWLLAIETPGIALRLVGLVFTAAIVLAFVPMVGRMQSLHTLVLGGLALAFVLAFAGGINPRLFTQRVTFWPGFGSTVELLIMGAFMNWLGAFVAASLVTRLNTMTKGATETVGELVLFPIAAIFGYVPVFIYGAWLGLQLKGAG